MQTASLLVTTMTHQTPSMMYVFCLSV
jgi:hypothetical protein